MAFNEFKPRKAKYGFQVQIDNDVLRAAAIVYAVIGDIPQDEETWFLETPNNMGRSSLNVYINDRETYEKLLAASTATEVPQPKLVLALPDYEKQKVVIASDDVVDGERLVCIAIK